MNTRSVTVLCLALMASGVSYASGETIEGRLIDRACYERNPANIGHKHVRKPIDDCATTCVRFGLPAAILTRDGSVYRVVGDLTKNRNAALVPYVTQTVQVEGTIRRDDEGALFITATSVTPLAR